MRWSVRGAVVGLTLVGHLFAALGLPLPAPAKVGQPFPCQGHPCGCSTAAECWSGDCCCFTLSQKLAWAEANRIEPPAHARRLAEALQATPASCCAEKSCCGREAEDAPGVRWVAGVFAQRCRGEGPAGSLQLDPAGVPDLTPSWVPVCRPTGRAVLAVCRLSSVSDHPPVPPPRSC